MPWAAYSSHHYALDWCEYPTLRSLVCKMLLSEQWWKWILGVRYTLVLGARYTMVFGITCNIRWFWDLRSVLYTVYWFWERMNNIHWFWKLGTVLFMLKPSRIILRGSQGGPSIFKHTILIGRNLTKASISLLQKFNKKSWKLRDRYTLHTYAYLHFHHCKWGTDVYNNRGTSSNSEALCGIML